MHSRSSSDLLVALQWSAHFWLCQWRTLCCPASSMASLAFCVALAMMTSAISSIAEATDAGDWYVDLGSSETYIILIIVNVRRPCPKRFHPEMYD